MIKSVEHYENLRRLISIIAPNRCPFCRCVIPHDSYYCESCIKSLPIVRKQLPPPENISRLVACCYYFEKARRAVLWLKYGAAIYPADAFALMLSKRLGDEHADVIVPVPSSRKSVRNRGYVTTELIGKRLSMRLGIPLVRALDARNSKMEQKKLTAEQRLTNAQNAFLLKNGVDLRGVRVILLDDVCTTGATLSACGRILSDAGAAEVIAAVCAKTTGCGFVRLREKRYRLRGGFTGEQYDKKNYR